MFGLRQEARSRRGVVSPEQDMSLTVRDVQAHELDAILALNNAA